MQHDIATRLDAAFDNYTVVRRIHDVPPHEVYEVTVDGQRAVYKADSGPTGSAGMEGGVTRFVGEQTPVPVPEVLFVDADCYLAAWHDDAPAPDEGQPADGDWARAAGLGLAQLHEKTAPELDAYGTFRLADDALAVGRFTDDDSATDGRAVDGHDEWHAAAVDYVRGRRPVLDRYGHADVADAVIDFLEDNPDAFAGAGEPVCCHGWATPEHVSIVDGDIACMLDFEHAIAAPAEYDFCRTVGPAFGPDDDARAAFRTGYESVRPLPDGFEERRPLYGLLNGVYYFESLYVQDQHDPEATAERAARFRAGVSDILDELTETTG